MKKTIILTLTLLLLCAAPCTVYARDTSDESVASAEVSDSGYVNIEQDLKKISWVYYLIGGASVAGVITAAVLITKKRD